MSILHKILKKKRIRVKERIEKRPIEDLLKEIGSVEPPRDLFKALSSPSISLLAEFKRASPSRGPLNICTSPQAMAKAYEEGGAHAISVLTEEDFFLGSLQDLKMVKEEVHIPVLAKDFFINPYQIYEAYLYGADAILLIVGALKEEDLLNLHSIARELRLSVLFEVHDREELETLMKLVPKGMIGINNRDLKTFQVTLDTTLQLIDAIPPEYLVVSESGIKRREEVLLLEERGLHAILVGETLMVSTSLRETISSLLGVTR